MEPRRRRVPAGVDPARIPPGQTLTAPGKWPILSFGPPPRTNLETWNFRVYGAVESELQVTYAELRAFPATNVVADIHCVTGWSRLGDTWTGVAMRDIFERAKPAADARYVMAYSDYGYTTSLPIDALRDDNVLLCYGWNGEELSPDHGWPLRLFVPSRYFWKSAKWLRALELMPRNRLGFWEQRGYHDEADPWTEKRYW